MIKVIQIGTDFPAEHFKDWYNKPCIVSLSSLADDRCIWLGRIDNLDGRMLLNIQQVRDLLPVLERFVKTGDINPALGIKDGGNAE